MRHEDDPYNTQLKTTTENAVCGRETDSIPLYSATGTRTQVSCVRGKYDNHLHHGGGVRQPRIELGAQRWQRWILPLNHWHFQILEKINTIVLQQKTTRYSQVSSALLYYCAFSALSHCLTLTLCSFCHTTPIYFFHCCAGRWVAPFVFLF